MIDNVNSGANAAPFSMEENKRRFIGLFTQNIKRDGAEKLMEWLMKSDFFTAPASTKFHGNFKGGLCQHSLNVYDCLCDILARERVKNVYHITQYTAENMAIAGLLHDLCKVNFYKESRRNQKNPDTGKWEEVPYFSIEDNLPYGHGEKSVYIISGFMRLTRDEAFAIRYHMGFSEDRDHAQNVGKALEMFPLAYCLYAADMEASYFMEGFPGV